MATSYAPAPAKVKRRPEMVTERKIHPWWFLAPAFAVLIVFFLVPTVYNFVYAFTDWSSFKSQINVIGTDNFSSLLENGTLLKSLRITLAYAVMVAIFQNLFGLLLALFLEKDSTVNRAARVVFFIPVVMSALAVGYIFQALLKPEGALNQILSFVTGQDVTIAWLGSTTWTLVIVAMIHAWKWMGLSMLVYLAGLKTISDDVMEAARLDGASSWQMFWKVRFPLIGPAITFNVATALLGSMNGFDIVQATTGGGPARSTEIFNIFVFRTFGQGLYAQATTMSLLLFVVVAVLAFPVIGMLRRREEVL
ncbi:carbohydrate ABC transporter permease [Sanguibacter suarezii]|uniref:carbohydrate ABC transporter permease n=1 Tax=Sanguibacter suarezii TaxID=60921 RepID=UPI000A7EB314|nr:sugar ABC transporter permease [Sanguibacter suarezii]